jgi:ABC-type sugar transport system ATPase subunit
LSALDDETRQDMCELLRAIQRRTGVTTLHVTHNQTEAMQLADRLLVLNAGVVAETALNRLGNGAAPRARSAEVRP